MNWRIESMYNAECFKEISVAVDGFSYLTIFGHHVNGGFCALPQWGVSCELSHHNNFEDIGYNTERIGKALKKKAVGRCIAEAIYIASSCEAEMQNKGADGKDSCDYNS